MYIKSTIHPYHQNEKSKVHTNQPFLKPICYYIRIEERERERKGRKEEKIDTILESYFLQTNPKSRLFPFVKDVPTIGIPKIGTKTRFLEFQKYGLFSHIGRFLEFQQQGLFGQHTDFWNSKNMRIPSLPIPCNLGKMIDCSSVLGNPNFCHWVCFSFVVHRSTKK